MANNKLEKNPMSKYKFARNSILLLIILTVLNCGLYLTGDDTYYLASIMLVYILFEVDPVSLIISIAILVPYVLSYFLSKKKDGWIIVALVLFCIDTLFVLLLQLYGLDMILDLIIHILLIVELAIGVRNRKLGVMSDEEIAAMNSSDIRQNTIFPEIRCAVGVAAGMDADTVPYDGILRFEDRELVVGAASYVTSAMIGEALTPLKEKARIPYENITGVVKDNKINAAVRLLLCTGGYLYALPSKAELERFFSLLTEHGVSTHIFDGLEQ